MDKVGIIGHGFVGLAVETGLQSVAEIMIYDKFKPSESLEAVVRNCSILFVCLPTPMEPNTGECITSIIEGSVEDICKLAKKSKVIVIKSTVPPGTTQKIQDRHKKHTFVFNPEFLTEKNFLQDFLSQDRIVLGKTNNIVGYEKLLNLYKSFTKTQSTPGTIIETTSSVAEMSKYIGNCFLATKVMFFNEIYEICKAAGIDFDKAASIAALDKRIGQSHIRVPGDKGLFGFGGSCFPKDMNALIFFAKNLDVDPMVLDSIWTKNLLVRQEYDWEKLAQVTGDYKKDD